MDYIGTSLEKWRNDTPAAAAQATANEWTIRARRLLRSLWRNKTALVGAVILCIVIVTAVAAPLLAPHDPQAQDLASRLRPPAWSAKGSPANLLGTDHLGRDILSRIIYGSRISLLVGIVTVLISGAIGTALGLLAGYYGGKVDSAIMRIADIQLAFPFILLALSVMAVLGTGLKNVIIVLSLTGWVMYGRVVRGEVLALREKEFVEAARALGNRDRRVILRHILPNVVTTMIIMATLEVARVIIAESSLTFLGLGVEPMIPTWGGMLSDGREYLSSAWWVATFPGLAIMFTVLGINLLGDWLRDTLDPRLKT